MTRGKYAARATLRREDTEVRSDIETYQHAVKRLTAEVADLNERRATEQAASKQEIRRLEALLAEGLSPELAALRSELERQRERSDKAVAAKARMQKRWDRLTAVATRWLRDETGCTGLEATEAVTSVLYPARSGDDYEEAGGVLIGDVFTNTPKGARLNKSAIELQAARGHRSGTATQQRLADLIAEGADAE